MFRTVGVTAAEFLVWPDTSGGVSCGALACERTFSEPLVMTDGYYVSFMF